MKTTQSKDGTLLAYDVYGYEINGDINGGGPALVVITGATCFREFEPVLHDADVFAQQFTVYSYDRRGRGDSGDTLPYATQREVEDIDAMIDVAGGKAYLYGHSSGAILALEAAMQLGDKVSKLVLYDASYASDEADQKEFLEIGQWLSTLLNAGKHEEAISGFLEGIGIPQEMIGYMQGSPQWATIHAVAEQLRRAIPHAEYHQFAGQDHMPDPEVVLPVLAGFLERVIAAR